MIGSATGRIDLPSIPATLAKIMEVSNRPQASAGDLSRVVRLDQSLATKVLRMANSAYYGRMAKAETITEAVIILGFGEIRNFAASASVVDVLFPRKMFPGFDWPEMWSHSVICAVASEVIYSFAYGSSRSKDESIFVAGLLHDIGKLIVARALPEKFAQIVAACREYGLDMARSEKSFLSTTHALIGGDLATQWEFPERLVAGISYHHDPEGAAQHAKVVKSVCAANMLAKLLRPSYITDLEVEVSLNEVAETVGLQAKDMDLVVEEVRENYQRCGEMVAWSSGMPRSPQKAA